MCPSHGRCHPPIRENHGHVGIGKENRKAIHEAHWRPEPTTYVSSLCIFPPHISPFHVRVTLLTWTALEGYCLKMFLLPLIFEEMAKVKRWGTPEKGFMTFLVETLCIILNGRKHSMNFALLPLKVLTHWHFPSITYCQPSSSNGAYWAHSWVCTGWSSPSWVVATPNVLPS